MVATDAIGMGLNLSIGRVIFHSMMKTTPDERGNKSMEFLSTSHCLQIAGRAGRFNTAHSTGYVTTLRPDDLRSMREIMAQPIGPIERAGLHPTAEQIELFAFNLPHLTLRELVELFVEMCEFDESAFFICDMENFKVLSTTIEHIELPLKTKFLFCCAPANTNLAFTVAMFTKFARQYSNGEPMGQNWLKLQVSWPLALPKTIRGLEQLESVYDSIELYLWFSYRFVDIFTDQQAVRQMQRELDELIEGGVKQIVKLVRAARSDASKFYGLHASRLNMKLKGNQRSRGL